MYEHIDNHIEDGLKTVIKEHIKKDKIGKLKII